MDRRSLWAFQGVRRGAGGALSSKTANQAGAVGPLRPCRRGGPQRANRHYRSTAGAPPEEAGTAAHRGVRDIPPAPGVSAIIRSMQVGAGAKLRLAPFGL